MDTLLLAHGNLVLGETLAREIESFGYRVARAPTVRAAAALVEDGAYRLLVVDLASVGVAGASDLRMLRQARPEIRILLLSPAAGDAGPHDRAWAEGRLPAPFTRAELCAKIAGMTRSPSTESG